MSLEIITIKVLFFGPAADAAKARERDLEFTGAVNAQDAFDRVVDIYPALSDLKTSIKFAVNREYSDGTDILRSGDELALIPPVSGG
jgi:molybdopterin converting factor subunit 1